MRPGRALARALSRWVHPSLPFWYHPAYRVPLPSSDAPLDSRRADDALTYALDVGWLHLDDLTEPPELSWDDAALVHTHAWLAELDRPEVVARIVAGEAHRVSVRHVLETWRRACAGTVEATAWVLRRGGRALNLLGGFHHAERSKGGGYCGLNDVAIAVATARRDGFRGEVLIVDLDAHPPDGTAEALGDDPRVTLVSVSAASAWRVPPVAAARVVDKRVPSGTTDEAYLQAVAEVLEGCPRAELAFYLAGADPLAEDALGGLAVSEAGLRERDRRVLGALGETPLVVVPAGGYHPRSWRILAGTIGELVRSRREVPPGYDPLHRRTKDISRALDPRDLAGGDALLLTEEDILGSLGRAPPAEPRFLGYYTRHGLEHALTAYGYLTTLRRLGFDGLEVELEAANPDRMRVTAAVGEERATLVDLSVSVRVIRDQRVLYVEWLELVDPRSPFTTHRPQLPGQRRPGLGLAEETLQLLVRAAERLGLAGVAYVPSHYHVAWMSRERFVIVDPTRRGEFRALLRHLGPTRLLDASAILAGRGLPTEDGEVIRWVPTEMVVPLDPELARRLEEEEPLAALAEEALAARLLPLQLPGGQPSEG